MTFVKPNFFLIGAAKSGTTTLSVMLDHHPQIYISPIKEPNYFSQDIDIEKFSDEYRKITFFADELYFRNKPLTHQHLSFIRDERYYLQLFEEVTDQIAIGECSTSYLYSSVAAREIKNFNPEAKIIAILRNPITRAFSHYLMALKYGLTNKTFIEEIKQDISQKEKGWGISRLYIELGMYSSQLERFYLQFPHNQILILLQEDLMHHPEKTFSSICSFLEVDNQKPQIRNNYHEAVMPRFNAVNRFLTSSGIRKFIQQNMPATFTRFFKPFFYSKKNLPVLTPEDKNFLMEIYRQDIQKTSEIIGRDLSHWLS